VAPRIPDTPSSTLKSNLPSCGSIWFQETPARTVLSLASAAWPHTGFMYSRLVARCYAVPGQHQKGLPSTISWVAVLLLQWGYPGGGEAKEMRE